MSVHIYNSAHSLTDNCVTVSVYSAVTSLTLLQSDTSDKHAFEFRDWAGNNGQSSVISSPLLREHYENFTG
jgi:hypothetical protein